MPLSTLRLQPRDGNRKTQGQDGVAFSFPVGILPPLQHAGLSRRTPSADLEEGSRHDAFRGWAMNRIPNRSRAPRTV